MNIYYSHPKTYKNSPEEAEDIAKLESLGYEVVNPYDAKFADFWQSEGIEFGRTLVDMCDAIAFRALSNNKIGAGVGKEIQWAAEKKKVIMELPDGTPFTGESYEERLLTIDETVEFFKTVGK